MKGREKYEAINDKHYMAEIKQDKTKGFFFDSNDYVRIKNKRAKLDNIIHKLIDRWQANKMAPLIKYLTKQKCVL